MIFPQGQGRRERTTAHTDTHRHTPPGYLGKKEHAGKRWRKDWCQHINTIGITRCIGMHRQRQRDNMDDHMVSVIPQLNRDMRLKLELNQQQVQADIHR